ncbi:hypothetical protein MMC25_002324 [Agyrium rufum]|nr:hypothetical protein [Agyrium rufum]
MSSGPLPSTLHLLQDLPSAPIGSKVRFLGCVKSYATREGKLRLKIPGSWSSEGTYGYVETSDDDDSEEIAAQDGDEGGGDEEGEREEEEGVVEERKYRGKKGRDESEIKNQGSVSAIVDINLLLATIKSTDTRSGEWLNVIGYVEDVTVTERRREEDRCDECDGVTAIITTAAAATATATATAATTAAGGGSGEKPGMNVSKGTGKGKGQGQKHGIKLVGPRRCRRRRHVEVGVKAVLLWSAGAIDIDAYESAVRKRMKLLPPIKQLAH